MPFKIRTKLIVAFMALISGILVVTGLVGYYNLSASDRAVHKVEAIAEEIIVTGYLHRSLEHVLMPANDYLITGDRKYIDDFNVSSKRVEEAFKKTDELLGYLEAFGLPQVEEERKSLKDIKTAWLNIKELSLKILSIPDPIGNKDGARMMEEMDYRWGGPATELIDKWQKGDVKEYKEAVELAEKAIRMSWVIMGSAGTLLLILGAGFAVFYSGFFVRPIKKLHNGADAIAGGDFKSRVDVKTGDELEQLSNAMNEMAEKLDDFYGTLENQVRERTRELQESEERFRVIAETAADAIITMKWPGIVTLWNKSAERIFGYAADEVIGKDLHNIIVPERYREKSREGLNSFFETGTGPVVGKAIEVFGLRKDGSEFSVELSISAMRIKDEWQAAAIVRDITERKQAEAAFRTLVGAAVTNVGAEFFHETVSSLCTWLGVECVIIGELVDEGMVRALAMQLDGKAVEHYEYVLAGTPCESATQKGYCEYHEGVIQLFPLDKDLVGIGAEAYVGIPLRDKNGQVNGIICAISRHKFVPPPMVKDVFAIIAARAGVEIERKRTEETLRVSEEMYRSLFDNMLNGLAYCRMLFESGQPQDFIYLNVNHSFEALTGLKGVVGKKVTEVIPGVREADPGLFEIYGRVALSGKPERFEMYLESLRMWFWISVYSPRKEHFVAVFDVITERKKIEEALKASEERFRTITNTAGDAIICLEAPGNIKLWNKKAEEIFGYLADDVMGKDLHDLIVPEKYLEKAREGLKGFFQTGAGPVIDKTVELTALRKDGTEFPIALSISALKIEGEWQATGIIRDITERKKAEQELMKSRQRTQHYLDIVGVMLISIDAQGRVQMVNRKGCEMLGHSETDILGKDWFDNYLPEPVRKEVREVFTQMMDGNVAPVEYFENDILTGSGDVLTLAWHNSLLLDESGRINGALSSGEDITDRKKAEERIKEQLDYLERFQKVAVKREFRIKDLRDENDRLKARIEEMEKKFKS